MAEAQFTPGPWTVGRRMIPEAGNLYPIDAPERTVAFALEEDDANARLIAAAPALYEMLSMFVDAAKPRGPDGHHEMPRFSAKEIALAQDALAKARAAA